MVLSIYDNTQISSIGADLLRFRFGIFARAGVGIVGSDECGGFGDKLLRQREVVCYVRVGKDLTSGE